jgi:ATP-dependent DNA helicase RecG
MDTDRLLTILGHLQRQNQETGPVEFKSNWDNPADIGVYLSALANAAALERHKRGWLIWGVNNHSHAIIGTTFNPFAAKGEGNQPLVMWLTQLTTPRPDFQFHEVHHQDGRVVMMEIYPPRTAPLAFRGVRYIRVDSHTTKLSEHPDKEARLWETLIGVDDWAGEIVANATIDDLDHEAVEFARARFTDYLIKGEPDASRHERIRAATQELDVATLLNKAHVTKQGRLTRAALLLLGKDESAHFLAPADTKLSWILRDSANRTVGGRHFGLPFILSSEQLFRQIRNIPMEHMPDGTLFPTPISQYDSWVIREALHNCIAHQDYRLGGKINVVEHPNSLVFTNLGAFIPPSIKWMLEHQSPPEHYRNQWLISAMIRLRMIDQIGSGIRRMFETQRERLFPLPDYTIDASGVGGPRVEVSITGKILDAKYAQILLNRSDLSLDFVILLDRVQKNQKISSDDAKKLRAERLIEGRAPNYFLSAKVAEWTDQKASYIRNRGFDDDYYMRLIVEFIQRYGQASRKDLDELLIPKLSDVLTQEQKQHKVRNLIQTLRRDGVIQNMGVRGAPNWVLGAEEAIAKLDKDGEG